MIVKIIGVENAKTWKGNIEKIFFNIMVNEINEGNMDSGSISNNIWSRMLLEINSQGKRNFNLKQLKQKFNKLHVMHHEFFNLLKHTRFEWDVKTNTMYALEET